MLTQTRVALLCALVAAHVILTACGTTSQYLAESIPPCTPISGYSIDPCEPDVKIQTNPMSGAASGPIFDYNQPQTIREFLDASISFIPHIVLRGTYMPDTARCTSGNPLRTPSYVEPGYFQNAILFQCFADVRVNSYILGTGPARLTVQVLFHPYWEGYYADSTVVPGATEQEVIELMLEGFVRILEEGFVPTGGGIYGREVALFISPGASHGIETWEVYETWDVQRQEDDTVVVVHPHRDRWRASRPDDYQTYRSQLEMEIPAFTRAVTTAHQARVAEYSGRIAPEDIQSRAAGIDLPMLVTDANQLRQFYTDTGAFTHPDGPPAQPPPPCGLTVPDQANNPGLMRDCINLLAVKDALRGSATLNWSVETPISEWDGVAVEGSPSRVARLLLNEKGLDGTVPPELARLDALQILWLNTNQLTGQIPPELGDLAGLNGLALSKNRLDGEIPPELANLANLDYLWLNDNQLAGQIPPELADIAVLRALLLNNNQLTGQIPSELGELTSLEDLWLTGNQLTGCIPPALRNLPNTDIQALNLQPCQTQ